MPDFDLRQDVLDELDFDPSINAAQIGVAVEKGIVTLSGHVSSYAEKIAAERIALRVRGVRGVAQEIEVRYPDEKKDADDEIAQRAAKILEWDSGVPLNKIKVKVERGYITLSGAVDWQFQRKAAETAVHKLSGVRGVINTIVVHPNVDAFDIKRRIENALKRNAELEADEIRVTASDGRVTLEGKVHAWSEREIAQQAAWAAPGVVSVDDRLTLA